MKKIKTVFISAILCVALMLLTCPALVNASAKGGDYTANEYVAGRLDLILSEYPVGSYFSYDGKPCTHHNTNSCGWSRNQRCNCRSSFYDSETGKTLELNSIQCMGFAHYSFYKIFGFIDRSDCGNSSLYYSIGSINSGNMTAENCKNLILQADTGAHIRAANKHSMVFLSGDENGFTVLHCNAGGHCGVSIKYWTWSEFANNFRAYGIAYVNMPKVYPNDSGSCIIKTSSPFYTAGTGVTFNWTPVAGVRSYKLAVSSCTDSNKTAVYSSLVGLTKTVKDGNLFVPGNMYKAEIYAGSSASPGSATYFYIAPSRSFAAGQTVKSASFMLKNTRNSGFMHSSGFSNFDRTVTSGFYGGENQTYYFEYVGSGLYRIHLGSPDSNMLLTLLSDSMGSVPAGTELGAFGEDASCANRQLFYVIPSNLGYTIEPACYEGCTVSANSSNGSLTLVNNAQTSYGSWYFCDLSGNITDPAKTSGYIPGNYTIATESTSLNVRLGPSTSYNIVGSVSKGEGVTVTLVDGEWGYIASSKVSGWISLTYAKFVSPVISSVAVNSPPDKTVYSVGERIDVSGLSLRVNYSDGTSDIIYDGFECDCVFITAGDPNDGYNMSVTASYGGKSTAFTVKVLGDSLPSSVITDIYGVNTNLMYLSGISPGVTFDEFIGGFYASGYIKVYNGENEVNGGDKISTGMILKVTDGVTVTQTLTAVVTGDVNGDGISDISDILTIQSHLLGKSTLSGVRLCAADCNGDGKADISDILTIQSYALGKSAIKPQRY